MSEVYAHYASISRCYTDIWLKLLGTGLAIPGCFHCNFVVTVYLVVSTQGIICCTISVLRYHKQIQRQFNLCKFSSLISKHSFSKQKCLSVIGNVNVIEDFLSAGCCLFLAGDNVSFEFVH